MQTHTHTHSVARFHSYSSIKVHSKRKLLSDGFQFPTQGHIAIFTLLSQCSLPSSNTCRISNTRGGW